ncbi:MAG: phosphotransferase [Sulfuricaulis sp.]|nr:phosphotransferase [Sulfuricaulis sp.]
MSKAFPTSIDAVDVPWLSAVLTANGTISGGDRLLAFDAKPLGEGFGQTGVALRLGLSYAQSGGARAGPASLIAKFATSDDTRRKASTAMGLYQREVDFYLHRASTIKVRSPRCYFADSRDEGEHFALLLEDFPVHRPGDETVGCTVDDARLAVPQMARLHGPYWNATQLKDRVASALPSREAFANAWDEMQGRFGEYLPPAFVAARDAYLEAIPALQAWINAETHTLIHGDFRLDNLLFGPRGALDAIVVLDWQAVRAAKGMQDFAYLISHSMNVEERRTHERDLLRLYIEALREEGVSYDLDTALDDYRRAMLYLFCYVLYITGININTHERALRRKKALIARASTAILDWDALALLPRFA